MKITCLAVLTSCCLAQGYSAPLEDQLDLRGIVNLPGQRLAVLQRQRDFWIAKPGDREYGVELLDLDMTNDLVRTRVAGEEFTNRLATPQRPPEARSWIHLEQADPAITMELFGKLLNRTLLLHPQERHPFSCNLHWTNPAPTQTEIADGFASALKPLPAVAVKDGDCFLQVIPENLAPAAHLGAGDLPAGTNDVQNGMIDFEGVSDSQVIDLYAKLIGRKCLHQREGDVGRVYFQTARPISKEQTIYALETLLRWNDCEIVLNDDQTFSVTNVSAGQK